MSMFRRMFGGPQGANGAGVSASSTGRTVDAIQKLGEVYRHSIWRTTLWVRISPPPRAHPPLAACMSECSPESGCLAQTEELLVKRRNLLENKIEQETERAKEFTRTKNKRGAAHTRHHVLRLAVTACSSHSPHLNSP